MRLLARVYADGNTPSKVSFLTLSLRIGIDIDDMTVVAEFYETQIHGQITVVICYRYQQEMQSPFEQSNFKHAAERNRNERERVMIICTKLAF